MTHAVLPEEIRLNAHKYTIPRLQLLPGLRTEKARQDRLVRMDLAF